MLSAIWAPLKKPVRLHWIGELYEGKTCMSGLIWALNRFGVFVYRPKRRHWLSFENFFLPNEPCSIPIAPHPA